MFRYDLERGFRAPSGGRAHATIEHLQHVHGVRRVVAEMDVRNVASVAVAESLGFRHVETRLGVRRGYGPPTGEFVYELCLTRA